MGTIMHKGEMYGGGGSNSNLITLKWAEYNALPAADKADLNKYYYIEDLNTGSDLVTQISNPADNQFLMYDSSKGLWVNHAGGLYQYIPLTEDEYNALTTEQKNDPSKLYYVTDVDVVNANIDDTTISTEKVWSSKKVSDEVDAINSKLTVERDTDHGVVFRKMGNVVCIEGYGVSAVNINATTVPAKFRPSTTQNPVIAPVVFLSTSAGMLLGYIGVATGGSLNLRVAPSYGSAVSSTTNGSAYFTITFIKE